MNERKKQERKKETLENEEMLRTKTQPSAWRSGLLDQRVALIFLHSFIDGGSDSRVFAVSNQQIMREVTQFDQKRTSELSHVGLEKRETPRTRVTSAEKARQRTEERKSDKDFGG